MTKKRPSQPATNKAASHKEWKERFALKTATTIILAILAFSFIIMATTTDPNRVAWAQSIISNLLTALGGVAIGKKFV